ncbi:MAG TPA: hypothetical protein VFY40_09845 [Blastocatellia bacterium]|nr:hypothetical protein [Blastocatellia bacterium]
MNTYERGQTVTLRIVWKDAAGALVDPSALTVQIKDPLGVATQFTFGTDEELIRDSQGNYHIDRDPSLQGRYNAKWQGTSGAKTGIVKDEFLVVEDFFD